MQNFTIKDLRRIETEIDNELQYVKNELGSSKTLSTTIECATVDGITKVSDYTEKFSVLIEAKFKIRELVAEFNSNNGINVKTAKIAILQEKLDFTVDNCINYGKVREQSTGYSSTAPVKYASGLSIADIDTLRANVRNLKRQIQRLKDSCNGINASNKVEGVTAELISVFTKYGFID